jgi:hypothetical protein
MPMPPAADTAATSSGLEHGYIAPQISGTSMPSCRENAVVEGGVTGRGEGEETDFVGDDIGATAL